MIPPFLIENDDHHFSRRKWSPCSPKNWNHNKWVHFTKKRNKLQFRSFDRFLWKPAKHARFTGLCENPHNTAISPYFVKPGTTTSKTQLVQKWDHLSHNTQKPTFFRKTVFFENWPHPTYFHLHHLPQQFLPFRTKFHKIIKLAPTDVKTCAIDGFTFFRQKWWPSFFTINPVCTFSQQYEHRKCDVFDGERGWPKFGRFTGFCEKPAKHCHSTGFCENR